MFKLANQVIDQHDDVSLSILKKLAKVNPSVYMLNDDERNKLRDSDFALSVITKKAAKINKFPINDKDSTWLSKEFFSKTAHKLPKEAAEKAATMIKIACTKFKIDTTSIDGKNVVDELAIKEREKIASATNVYFEENLEKVPVKTRTVDLTKLAEVSQICENYTYAQYAFSTPNMVKLAGQYFDQFHVDMPDEFRYKYAHALRRRANELGTKISGAIEKYASDSYGANVDAHIRSRKSLLTDERYSKALTKIASLKNEMKPLEFAELLHSFDKKAGLDRYYGGHVVNPYHATFSGKHNPNYIYKTASTKLTEDQIGKLATAKYNKIKEYFGQSIADSFKQDPVAIFESLPKDAKEIMAGIANGQM